LLTRYARREIRIIALLGGLATGATAYFAAWWACLPLLATGLLLAFFRDPPRRTPSDTGAIFAPADGRVLQVQRDAAIPGEPGRWLRVLIFLSVLDVHINRAPCAGRVARVEHRPGGYRNALRPEAAATNESSMILLSPPAPLPGPIRVRQIAGAIARRIVCAARENDVLAAGQRYGMIKFGSQTEVCLPESAAWRVLVSEGSRVRAGVSILARFESEQA
jgi:phosphatidylserine decarboxylase